MKNISTELKMVATAELEKQVAKELKQEDPKKEAMASLIQAANEFYKNEPTGD